MDLLAYNTAEYACMVCMLFVLSKYAYQCNNVPLYKREYIIHRVRLTVVGDKGSCFH